MRQPPPAPRATHASRQGECGPRRRSRHGSPATVPSGRPGARLASPLWALAHVASAAVASPAAITGELKQRHKVTLTVDGPYASERATDPNPFLDYHLTVRFTHESGAPSYEVPGYFAADGRAGETSAEDGTRWRAWARGKPGARAGGSSPPVPHGVRTGTVPGHRWRAGQVLPRQEVIPRAARRHCDFSLRLPSGWA
jgi:hypothetical protein